METLNGLFARFGLQDNLTFGSQTGDGAGGALKPQPHLRGLEMQTNVNTALEKKMHDSDIEMECFLHTLPKRGVIVLFTESAIKNSPSPGEPLHLQQRALH